MFAVMGKTLLDHATGYRTEAPYPIRFHRELNPRRMVLALAAQGLSAPSCDQPYTDMELGFGQGVSLVMLAAANPHAQFYGVDLMPEHVAHARGLAEAAGLSNLHVRQLTFAELEQHDWPVFDFIVAHGVWSWVAAPVRDNIRRFIDARLKPRGLLYLSYNTRSGWASMEPIRAIMKRVFDETSGALEERVTAAMARVHGIENAKGLFFRANPTVPVRLKQMESEGAAYLAHEFLNAEWKIYDFADVADDWGSLGLVFAASANLQDNAVGLTIRDEARALYNAAGSISERETLKDYLLNKQFRRDIFVRDPVVLDEGGQREIQLQTRFMALMSVAQLLEAKLTTEIMTVTFTTPLHQALVGALAIGPQTIGQLQADPTLTSLNTNAAFGTLFLLCAMKALAPAAPDVLADAAVETTERLNAEIARRVGTPGAIPARALALIGGGIAA